MTEEKGSKVKKLALLLLHYTRTKRRRSWSSREAFERWQERQVLRHLHLVRRKSPFYRELWGDRQLQDWRTFPLIDKSSMMENFSHLNTAGINREEALNIALAAERTRNFQPRHGQVTVGLSSGTSGSRGLFLVSAQEQAAWAGVMLAKVLPGPLWHEERIAFFLRANSNLYESVRGGRLEFQYFDLLDPIEQHVERLNAYGATIWAAPPSVLRLLAARKLQGTLTAQPRRIIAAAEVLDPVDERMLGEAFDLPIHQVYQCTEGFLACTCTHGTLHLNEDIVHIQKEPVPGDDTGRRFVPIVTDFTRITQPIIRYRLNDVLTEAEAPCPCGSVFTAIERIEGRCDDVFYLEHREDGRLVPVFPDYITRAVIGASDAIAEYRVIQQERGGIHIDLLLTGEGEALRKAVESQVTASLQELALRLNVWLPALHFGEYMFQPGVQKLRRVERRRAVGQ